MKNWTYISTKIHFVRVRSSFQPVKTSLYFYTIPRDSVGVSPGSCNPYNPDHSFRDRGRWVSEVEGAGLSFMTWWRADQSICNSSCILKRSCPLPSPAWFIWLLGDIVKRAAGLPWWCSGWESACRCGGHGFGPWSGRIPHAAEQLGPWATTTEPAHLESVLRNKGGHDSERPAHGDEEWPPLAATGESPRTEAKTQHSQK